MLGVLLGERKQASVAVDQLVVPDTFRDYYDGVLSVLRKLEAFAREQQRAFIALTEAKGVQLPKGPMQVAEKTAADAQKRLELVQLQVTAIARALQAGFEPTQPQASWYCGFINEHDAKWRANGRVGEIWPSKNEVSREHRITYRDVLTFQRPMPIPALESYAVAKPIFGDQNLRVYSPTRDDFKVELRPLPKDPVIIGCIALDDKDHFFEVARWDIDEDLRKLWEGVAQ